MAIGGKPSKYNVRLNYDKVDTIIEIIIDDCCIGFVKNKLKYVICNCEENREIEDTGINSMCIPVNGKITSEYSYRIHP